MSKITPELLKRNKEIRESFLVEREIPPEYKLPSHEPIFGFIYCIENTKNSKKYIGATYSVYTGVKNPHPYSALRKRASHYIYEYNIAMNQSTSTKNINRPIVQAFCDDGIENFIMYPIAETTCNNHIAAEEYFIRKYDTINKGYNVVPGCGMAFYTGRPASAKAKASRSDPIIAINMNLKQIIFSDSMKLLGDFLGTSKDIIKNNNRSGRPYKGWFIFYINDEKRNHILNHFVLGDNLGVQKSGNTRCHSDKSKKFYSELCSNISRYIKDSKSELFPDFKLLDRLEYKD